MPNDLSAQLDSIAQTFAADLLNAIREASMSEVFSFGREANADHGSTKTRAAKGARTPATGPSRARPSAPTRDASKPGESTSAAPRSPAADTLRAAQSIVDFVRKKPGVGGVEIRKSLGMAPPAWVRAIQHCRTGGLVRMVGRTKSARYWVG